MADNPARSQARGRYDLLIDGSRCLRMRFSESSCRRCSDACPYGAISLDGTLSVDPVLCTGCLGCTVSCPSGAFEQAGDFCALVAQLSRVPDPVLGCDRTRDNAHATVACLGGLAEEHLVALSHTLSGKVTLNLTCCGDCPNDGIVSQLLQRLHHLAEAELFDSGSRIVLAESPADLGFTEESVDRRSFFKAFRNSIFKSAALVLSSTGERAERRTEYSRKRVPIRRAILSDLRKGFSPSIEERLRQRFDSQISFNSSCTSCQGCVAICPTGALQAAQPEQSPAFNAALCTGCGLCGEFCMDGAVVVERLMGGAGRPEAQVKAD